MQFRIFIILFALFGPIAPPNTIHGAPRRGQVLSACAAFGPDGISVVATIDATNASVEFTDVRLVRLKTLQT